MGDCAQWPGKPALVTIMATCRNTFTVLPAVLMGRWERVHVYWSGTVTVPHITLLYAATAEEMFSVFPREFLCCGKVQSSFHILFLSLHPEKGPVRSTGC